MIEIAKLKKEATNLIESDKLRDCMNQMKAYLLDGSDERRLLSSLLRRYNQLFNERNLNIVEDSHFRQGMNVIADTLLDLVEQLNSENVRESLFIETILIVCNADKRSDMEIFFGKKYFPNAEFINYGEPLPKGIYDIIILEDENNIINQMSKNKAMETPTEENTARRKLMKTFLDASDAYFLYIGSRFTLGYENKVYFANSRFAIYARLKELLDYMKYYGK